MVKNPPSNAGDMGSIPGQSTKIPHDAGQPSPLSPWATTRESLKVAMKTLLSNKQIFKKKK